MKRTKAAALFTAIIFVLLTFSSCNAQFNLDNPGPSPENEDLYEVIRVVDGDTIIIDYNAEDTRVRLIGVDAPESVSPTKEKNCKYGEIASGYVKNLLEGKSVSLEFDEEQYDRYDRMLAYVYLDDEMLNLNLVQNGYAEAKEYKPNVKYSRLLKLAQQKAQQDKTGMWSDNVTDEDTGGLKEKNRIE
ncbi:MAG: thermonuclease family protein [Acutalibacteraceae bacterium]